MNFYEMTIYVPYFLIPDWIISLWLIAGGIGVMIQQFSIALTGKINRYNEVALKLTPLGLLATAIAYSVMIAIPVIPYYFACKHWRQK